MRSAFLSVGFRPFFFSGVLFSCLAMALWASLWSPSFNFQSVMSFQPLGGMTFWHAHEMLLGFSLAIIMGFLLTAVQNWTGLKTTTPLGLVILLTAWLIARVSLFVSQWLPVSAIILLQLLPILGIAFLIAKPILKKQMWRNLFVPLILLGFAALEYLLLINAHLGNNAYVSQLFGGMILLIVILVSMIAGRVFPFFIANRLHIPKKEDSKPLFLCAVIPVVLLFLLWITGINATSIGSFFSIILLLILTIAHSVRLVRWHHKSLWKEPMLWSLWLFYIGLPLAFLTMALDIAFDLGLGTMPLHIITIGPIAGLIMSMVSRVSSGHTGRPIQADATIICAFLFLALCLIVRTALPTLLSADPLFYVLASILWVMSFGAIFIRFAKIWLTPRPDGR